MMASVPAHAYPRTWLKTDDTAWGLSNNAGAGLQWHARYTTIHGRPAVPRLLLVLQVLLSLLSAMEAAATAATPDPPTVAIIGPGASARPVYGSSVVLAISSSASWVRLERPDGVTSHGQVCH
jgi:hypothetical protein